MEYPAHLLPQKNYKIINFDKADLGLRYLVRHIENTDIQDSDGRLRAELVAIQSDHLKDYSTNLFGTFKLTDLQWQFGRDTPCTLLWNPGDEAYNPNEQEVILITQQRGCFFLSISTFHQASFATKVEREGEQQVTCKVIHTPIKSNFWHCSLRWFCNEQGSDEWNKGRMNRMKAYIRSFISQKAELTEPVYQAIDPLNYTT